MRLVTTLLLLTVLAPPAGAASKRRQCAQACGSLIAACAARNQDLGDFGRACKTVVLRECRKAGPAGCLAGSHSPSTTTTSSSTTTTTLRFVDNGDGTVTDHRTGLQWEQKNSPGGGTYFPNPHDVDNRYTWSTTGQLADGQIVTEFLSRLNGSAPAAFGLDPCVSVDGRTVTGGFANHCDWRLPSIAELQGIVDLSVSGCFSVSPCIDQTVFGPTVAEYYWSAITNASLPNVAWDVDFASGVADRDLKSFDAYVCAVRSGP